MISMTDRTHAKTKTVDSVPSQAMAIRQWIGRARGLNDRVQSYEEAANSLSEGCGGEPMCRERDRLRQLEATARLEIYDYLSGAVLTPRQYTVLYLHYLEYASWTRIAAKLNIERRYALQIHTQAVDQLCAQGGPLSSRQAV